MNNSRRGFALPIILLVVALLVAGGGAYLRYRQEKHPAEIADWKTYTDRITGLTFQYPSDASENAKEGLTFNVLVNDLNRESDSPDYDRPRALNDKAALSNGDPSINFYGTMPGSLRMLHVPGVLAKELTSLEMFDVDDVRFERRAIIYKDNYQIILIWAYKGYDIQKNNPSYFNVQSYASVSVWKNMDGFYADLVAGKTDAVSQRWFTDFDKILKILRFVDAATLASLPPQVPQIVYYNRSDVPVGGIIAIKGANLNPLGGYSGIGWLTSSHIFVKLTDAEGKTAILWEGGSQGGNVVKDNKLTVTIPARACMGSVAGAGGCPADKYLTIAPGKYSLTISVDGRGTSEAVPITVMAPAISQSGWRTYTNAQYGFEFQYPVSWERVSDAFRDYGGINIFMVAIYPRYPAQDLGASIAVFESDLATTIRNYFSLQYTPSSTVLVNGISWTKMQMTNYSGAAIDNIDYLTEKNGKTYDINGLNDLVTQILLTFKFTDNLATNPPVITSEPTNVYDITDLGVQFILPASLSDLTYQVVNLGGEQAVNSVVFSSKRLEALGCGFGTAPLGYLTYNNYHGGEIIAHARNSGLYYIPPTGQCKADVTLQDWSVLRDALKTLVTDYKGQTPSTTPVLSGSATPHIAGITPSSASVGYAIEIKGSGLAGFEGETYLYFVKENGESGSISANSYLPSGDASLKFVLPEKMCTKNMGESGLPCPSFMTVTPGVYKVYAWPWGNKSNEVQFTVTPADFELQYPDINAYLKTLDNSWLVGGGNAPIFVSENGFDYDACIPAATHAPMEPVKSRHVIAGREYCLVSTDGGGAAGTGGTTYEYVTHVSNNDVGIVFEVAYRLSENFDPQFRAFFEQILSTLKVK